MGLGDQLLGFLIGIFSHCHSFTGLSPLNQISQAVADAGIHNRYFFKMSGKLFNVNFLRLIKPAIRFQLPPDNTIADHIIQIVIDHIIEHIRILKYRRLGKRADIIINFHRVGTDVDNGITGYDSHADRTQCRKKHFRSHNGKFHTSSVFADFHSHSSFSASLLPSNRTTACPLYIQRPIPPSDSVALWD